MLTPEVIALRFQLCGTPLGVNTLPDLLGEAPFSPLSPLLALSPPPSLLSKTDLYLRRKPTGTVLQCVTDFENDAGMDHYQVRSWRAWYAHITLSMLALAWLAASKAQAEKRGSVPATPA